MAQKLNVSMPQDLDLTGGWSVRITAVDASGNAVSGVNVSDMAIIADTPNPATSGDLGGNGFTVGPYMLVPGPAF